MTEASSLSPTGLRVLLAASPDEVPRARRMVREWLRAEGVTCDRATAELLVTELVTNALVHADPPIELRVQVLPAGGLRIEVLDAAGDQLPILDVTRRMPTPGGASRSSPHWRPGGEAGQWLSASWCGPSLIRAD